MKDLNKNEIYAIDGATLEQLEEVVKWLRANSRWGTTEASELIKNGYLRWSTSQDMWVRGRESQHCTATITSLFENDSFVLPEKWCVKVKGHKKELEDWRGHGENSLINEKGYLYSCKTWLSSSGEGGYSEITFEQFKKYVLKEENEMKSQKLIITRQALGEIYPKVCYTWQKKIETLLNEGLFKEEFEVMPQLVKDAFKAADKDFQKEWLEKYFPKPEKKMQLISCLQDGSDVWAGGGYSIDPLCTYERIQFYKDGLDVILKTNGNCKVLYLGYWNEGKY